MIQLIPVTSDFTLLVGMASVEQSRARLIRPPNVLTISVGILLFACAYASLTDLDFTWQIRTGQQIVESGQLRTVDQFSYTIGGQRVLDFEWLYEVLLYLVWLASGFGGLQVLKTFLIAVPLLIVATHLYKEEVPPPWILISCLAAAWLLMPFWNLRALHCTTIGLLLVATWLRRHCTGRQALPWLLLPVMLLWANLHPGVIVGQGLLLMAVAWEWLNRWLRINNPLSRKQAWRLTILGGLGIAATFLSPDPVARLLYPFSPHLRDPIMRIFLEMQPLYSFVQETPALVLLTYALAGLVLWSIVARFRDYRLWEIGLLIGLGVLANTAIRSLQDWLFVMLALGIPHAAKLFARRETASDAGRESSESMSSTIIGWLAPQPGWLAIATLVVLPIAVWAFQPACMPVHEICGCPRGAVDFIEKNDLQGKFFAPPNYGAYLGWRRKDKAKVYVDTRGFFYPPHILADSHRLPQLSRDWKERWSRAIEHYESDYLLLETTGPRGKLWHYLKSQSWKPLYLDRHSVLLKVNRLKLKKINALPPHRTRSVEG